MKCRLKAFFIGISICILIGNLISNVLFTHEGEEPSFGKWAEIACFYDCPELEEDLYPGQPVPSQDNLAYTTRHSFKGKRINPSSSSKNGLSYFTGKERKNHYTLSINLQSPRRFSSGWNEARLQLISFGRLLI